MYSIVVNMLVMQSVCHVYDIIYISNIDLLRWVMKYIIGQEREQIMLLPDCIDDLIGQNNPVRVIDAFIDSLNIDELDFKRSVPNVTGRPTPTILEIFSNSIYTDISIKSVPSRKLMAECTRNIELFFLSQSPHS